MFIYRINLDKRSLFINDFHRFWDFDLFEALVKKAAAPGLCGRAAGVLLSALARRKFECGGLAILASLMKHDGTAEHGGNTRRSNYHKPRIPKSSSQI